VLPPLKFIQVLTFASGLVVWIVAGTHPGLTLESPDQRLEDSWFKSLPHGNFLNTPTRCSVKCL
jgi:hypothetical protein